MIRLKSIERLLPRKHKTSHCSFEGCGVWTRQGKPYCTTHVAEHPYVRELLAELERRDHEEQQVKKKGPRAVDIRGTAAQEILQHLHVYGSRTLRRLAREFNRELPVVTHYVQALKRRGLVKLTRTQRGALVATVTEGGATNTKAA